jgi:hypothetical protein
MQMAFRTNAQDAPPVIMFSVPSPQQVGEGSNLTFIVTATDPEGAAIALTFSNWPPGAVHYDASIGNGTETGTFTYIPSFGARFGSPYDVIFVASDGVNLPVSNTMTIVVVAGNGVPVGLTNAAYHDGNFYFEMTGLVPHGTTRIIEVSTNLIDWVAIGTNGPIEGCGCFTDFESTNFFKRFYRVIQN